jgi:hypothetical protein
MDADDSLRQTHRVKRECPESGAPTPLCGEKKKPLPEMSGNTRFTEVAEYP